MYLPIFVYTSLTKKNICAGYREWYRGSMTIMHLLSQLAVQVERTVMRIIIDRIILCTKIHVTPGELTECSI